MTEKTNTQAAVDFAALAAKKASPMQKALAEFIASTTGKKVSADMVGIVQRFSAPYRGTKHYAEAKATWKGSKSAAEQARAEAKVARERERIAARRKAATEELERLAEIEAALSSPSGVAEPSETVAPEPAKPEPKAKKAAKPKPRVADKAPTKPVLTVVPDEDEDEADEPVEIIDEGGDDEFVSAEEAEDFGVTTEPVTGPVITFDDGEDADEDDDFDDDF